MNKKVLGIAAVVVVLAIGAFVMMGGGGPKPEETFEQIKAAATKKDVAGVEKYVDFDGIASSASDLILGKAATDPFTQAIWSEYKTALSQSFREMAASGDLWKGKKLDIWDIKEKAVFDLDKILGFRSWEYIGTAEAKKDGDNITCTVKVKDASVDKEFALDIVMAEENGILRIKSIKNLNNVAAERTVAIKEKLTALNKEIADKIAKAITISEGKIVYAAPKDSLDSLWSNDYAVVSVKLKNNTSKQISKIRGVAALYKDGSDSPLVGYTFSLPFNKKINVGESVNISDRHSLSSDDDSTPTSVLVQNFDNYKRSFVIQSITFADGENWELLRELPNTNK